MLCDVIIYNDVISAADPYESAKYVRFTDVYCIDCGKFLVNVEAGNFCDGLRKCTEQFMARLSSVSLLVCLWVTDVGYPGKWVDLRENFARIISPLSRLSAYRIWGMQFKGNISKFGVECRGLEIMCIFNRKLAISRKR